MQSVNDIAGVVYLEGSIAANVPTKAGPSNEPQFAIKVAWLNSDIFFEG